MSAAADAPVCPVANGTLQECGNPDAGPLPLRRIASRYSIDRQQCVWPVGGWIDCIAAGDSEKDR